MPVAEVAVYGVDPVPSTAAQPVLVTILHDDMASESALTDSLTEGIAVHAAHAHDRLVSESNSGPQDPPHAAPLRDEENTSELVMVTREGSDTNTATPRENGAQDVESSASHPEQSPPKCCCCHEADAVFRVLPCEDEYCQNCVGSSSRCVACGALITTVEHL